MKHRILCLLAVAALILVLTFPVAVPAAPPTPAAHATTATAATPAPEPHPEIREAIAALRRAREHLQHAAHDFGGHRVDAIKATDVAIQQLDLCLKYDK
jgi:hypothetical protein